MRILKHRYPRAAAHWIVLAIISGSVTLIAHTSAQAEATVASATRQAVEQEARNSVPTITWLTDYNEAMRQAKEQRRMLLVYFHAEKPSACQQQFEKCSLTDPRAIELIASDYVAVRIPLDTEIRVDGKSTRLLSHASFADLRNEAGVAIIDLKHPDTEQYGYVVNLLPFRRGKYYCFDPRHLAVMLELPPGTLTQRTMVFAVRIHPESPASTHGDPDPTLMAEAKSHSHYQARINNQGHHNWDSRFHRINGRLPAGLSAVEVVAESWPGSGLLDACIDCVASWRHSSGHWRAVRSRHPRFGYDIRRGSNGIWYATGLFGNRH